MNGKYLLDTNAIIALLDGNSTLMKILSDAQWVGISVISKLEFLSFSALTERDRQLFKLFEERVEVIDLTVHQDGLITKVIELRTNYRLKLPDAIIGATAFYQNATLLTQDANFRALALVKTQVF